MRFLRTNTAVRLTVGPFFDKTDGVTPETGITVTSCKLTFMVDDANVPTLVLDTAPTASGGANDMVHVTGDDAGFYDLELAAANVNYLGRAMLAITDAATHCPVFHEFMILPAMIYDSLVLGTDRLDTNVTHAVDTAWASVAITATAIASDAITSAKVADGFITAAKIAADAITAAKIADGAIDRATFAADTGLQTIRSNTATAGAAGSITLDASASAVDDFYLYALIAIVSGTGVGQARIISDYVGATKVATISPNWATNPDNTSVFAVIPSGVLATTAYPTTAEIADGVWDEAASGHLTSGTFGQRLAIVRANTAQAGANGSITLDASASAVNDFYKDSLIYLSAGTGVGQTRTISGYTGASKVATITPNWATNPSSDSVFVIIPNGAISGASAPSAADVADAVWDEDATAHQTQGTFGQAIGDPGATTSTIYSKVVNLPASPAASNDATERNAIADALLARAVEGTFTFQDVMRELFAINCGETSGGGTATLTFYKPGDDTTARAVYTVTSAGNRTNVVYTPNA